MQCIILTGLFEGPSSSAPYAQSYSNKLTLILIVELFLPLHMRLMSMPSFGSYIRSWRRDHLLRRGLNTGGGSVHAYGDVARYQAFLLAHTKPISCLLRRL